MILHTMIEKFKASKPESVNDLICDMNGYDIVIFGDMLRHWRIVKSVDFNHTYKKIILSIDPLPTGKEEGRAKDAHTETEIDALTRWRKIGTDLLDICADGMEELIAWGKGRGAK